MKKKKTNTQRQVIGIQRVKKLLKEELEEAVEVSEDKKKIEPKKTLDGEKERILKKAEEENTEKVSKSAEKKAFTFPSGEKKLKEEQMKRTEKKKNKGDSDAEVEIHRRRSGVRSRGGEQ